MQKESTSIYARQRSCGLTLSQQNAVDLLASGKNDTETATLLNLHRTTVTKWRLNLPEFQAALNQRRAEIWGAASDRLRNLICEALNVLGGLLSGGDMALRLKAAESVLKTAGFSVTAPGPLDAEEIVRLATERQRANVPNPPTPFPGPFDRALPPFEDDFDRVWKELRERADGAEPC